MLRKKELQYSLSLRKRVDKLSLNFFKKAMDAPGVR